MFLPKFKLTEDGHEVTCQSNHLGKFFLRNVAWLLLTTILGHFLLTELLLPKLERSSSGARIVNVSSKLHLNADTANIEVMNDKKKYGMFKTYARTKLANVGF